jgi:alpha-L-fucosidase 2
VALFYLDFLNHCDKGKDGKAIIGPSFSPEHGHFGIYQGTADITFMRMMFNIMIECSSVLRQDQDFAGQCAEALKLLPEYPLSSGNPPVVVDYANSITDVFNVTVPVLPVYPVGEVNYFSSEETKNLFKNTIDSIHWNGNNGVLTLAAARARLSMPNTLEWHKSNFSKRLGPNGTFSLNQLKPKNEYNNWGHYTEQFAFCGVVNEMLVQGLNGIIRFFPAWPTNIDASFTNLRTEGGFLVSAAMKKKEVSNIRIESTAGGKLTFLNLFDAKPEVTINGKPVEILEDKKDIYSVQTKVGDKIQIRK